MSGRIDLWMWWAGVLTYGVTERSKTASNDSTARSTASVISAAATHRQEYCARIVA